MRVKKEPLKVGEEKVRWTVLRARPVGGDKCLCRCRCGTEREVAESDLRGGKSTSCGCLKSEKQSARNRTHGLRHTPEWNVWNQMKQRCTNKKRADYPGYGGRGISVCQRWSDSFALFVEDMGMRPGPDYTLERKEVNGNYEPGNCIWLPQALQAGNTRRSRHLTTGGRTQTLQQWSNETGIPVPTILGRLRIGWSEERALTTPTRRHSWRKAGTAGGLSKERRALSGIKYRCGDPDNKDYGGRGVRVCRRWQESFDAFLEDVGPAPSPTHSLERKNNEGHYSCGHCEECLANNWPANVAWATRTTQNRNRSSNHLLTHGGQTLTLTEWASRIGVTASALRQRIARHGWSVERALTSAAR